MNMAGLGALNAVDEPYIHEVKCSYISIHVSYQFEIMSKIHLINLNKEHSHANSMLHYA